MVRSKSCVYCTTGWTFAATSHPTPTGAPNSAVAVEISCRSLDRQVEALDQRRPAFCLVLNEGVELLRRGGDELDRRQAVAEVGRLHDAGHLGVQLVDDRLRCASGREQAVPFG